MADEFQAGICSGNWWNSTRMCSTAVSDIGSFGWPTETVELKARSCEESASVSNSSIIFEDTQKLQRPDSISGGGSLMDSSLQIMDSGQSSLTMDWNQASLRSSGKAETNFCPMLQEELSSRSNFRQETEIESHQHQKGWNPKNFSGGGEEFKQLNQVFALDQQSLNCNSSIPASFPMGSASYGCPSTLLQNLLEPDPRTQHSPFVNRPIINTSPANYLMNTNEFSSWTKFPELSKSSIPKQQPTNQLHFSNNAPFWNASAASVNDIRLSFIPSSQAQFLTPPLEEKSSCSNHTAKSGTEDVHHSGSVVKKSSSGPAFKRPRIETPSPLPTFKVRKEKLGDRITALQQLVSPFGKTDTASVLFETTEYIKFLHEQVSVLSTPYTKNGAPRQHQQDYDKSKDSEGPKQDLRSRGLCLVPISSTFPVTNETAADFWTPTFGGTYR